MIDLERSQEKKIKRANTDWWIHEQSMVGRNGMTYITYVTDMGEIHVKEIDAKCSRTPSRDFCLCRLNETFGDEHNAPGICVMENGKIIVAYSGHGTPMIRYRITERPFDISSFGPEHTIAYNCSVTYVQLSENVKKNEIWLFTRTNRHQWDFLYSRDEGETFSQSMTFFSSNLGTLFYFDIHKQCLPGCLADGRTAEQWFFALYGHPTSSQYHKIHSGIFNADGDLLTMDGKPTGWNLYGGELLDMDSLAVVYEAEEGTTCRLLAVSPTLPCRVGIAAFAVNKPETLYYYSARWLEGRWCLSAPIAPGGEFLSPPAITDGSSTYVGGMAYYYGVGEIGLYHVPGSEYPKQPAVTETNRIFLARFDGENRVLESYVSVNLGKTYELEQTIRKIPVEKNIKIWRPVVPIYAQDNLPVYWHEGTYSAHTGGWHCDTVMYIEYDD